MKVAVVQFEPRFKDVAYNLHRMEVLIRQAAASGAKLIVLPELATTGYSFMSEEEARPFAETPDWLNEDMPDTSSMGLLNRLSRQLKVVLVWGFVEIDSGTKKLHNAQVLLTPDGSFISYRKINSFGNDFLWSTPGRSNPPILRVNFDGVEKRVGLLICRDVRDTVNDKWKTLYSPGDADIVCLSANWGDGGFPANGWMDFVEENKVTLLVSNRYGQETNNNFGEGGICVIEPNAKVHCQGLEWSKDCIVTADVG